MSLSVPLILATRNAGKLHEFRHLLAGVTRQVIGLDAFPSLPPVPETGTTFEENARLKARAVQAQTGGWVIADDSGLCVDALGGAPGVFSRPRVAPAGLAMTRCLFPPATRAPLPR
jgi:XTP/dITP diphosphohydrolase